MGKHKIFLIFFAVCILLYLPILRNPSIILDRGNDLQEFYWPIFHFTKLHLLQDHTLPLWNNMFFSGSPLLADPQSFLFYLPNIIFLLLPIDYAFIVSFVLHTLIAGLGAYLAARYGFGLSQQASIVTGLLYMVFPRTAGFLEAGHFGPFTFFTWLPFLVLSGVMLAKRPHLRWSVLFAISLAGLLFTFPTMFITAALLVFSLLFATGGYLLVKKRSVQTLLFLAIGVFVTFGLTAIIFLPQMEWLPQTTRHILLNNPDVYPKWNSKIEFVMAMYPHLLGGKQFANTLDNEKWIANGAFISLLSFIGFLHLRKKLRFLIISTVFGVILISLNNASPIYSLLLSTDWYVLGRVSTRVWFIVVLVCVFLAGFGFEILQKGKYKRLTSMLTVLAIAELLVLSWLRLERPTPPQKEKVPVSLYEFLKNDSEQFRVFCVNRCLSQQDVAKYKLQTVEGYGTVYQKNYYDQFIQLSQVFWDRYTSILPPFEIYKFREIQPYSPEIANYNVKYVISSHPLKDKNLELIQKFGDYLVYKNTITKSRAYFSNGKEAPIVAYSPNYIKVDTSSRQTNQIVIAEVYNSGWTAKLNGKIEVNIAETRNKLRQVDIEKDTQFVEMNYIPKSYQIGKTVTSLTLIAIFALFANFLRRKKGL